MSAIEGKITESIFYLFKHCVDFGDGGGCDGAYYYLSWRDIDWVVGKVDNMAVAAVAVESIDHHRVEGTGDIRGDNCSSSFGDGYRGNNVPLSRVVAGQLQLVDGEGRGNGVADSMDDWKHYNGMD